MDEEIVAACIRKWALKMAHGVKLAIPAKVAHKVIEELSLDIARRREIIAMARDVCTEVNNMSDEQVRAELEKYANYSEGAQVYQ